MFVDMSSEAAAAVLGNHCPDRLQARSIDAIANGIPPGCRFRSRTGIHRRSRRVRLPQPSQ
jgi:hypothetical protein